MGQTKKRKVPGFMRTVVADNVRRMMEYKFAESRNRQKALAKEAGITLSSVQRVLNCEVGASIETLEALAAALDLAAYQLLLPGLNTASPQIVRGALKNEEAMYRRWTSSGKVVPIRRAPSEINAAEPE